MSAELPRKMAHTAKTRAARDEAADAAALVDWLASQLGRELEALADQQVAGQAARSAAGVWGRGVSNRCFSAP